MATVRVGRHPARIAGHLFAANVTVPSKLLMPVLSPQPPSGLRNDGTAEFRKTAAIRPKRVNSPELKKCQLSSSAPAPNQ